MRKFPYWTVKRIINQLYDDTQHLSEPLKLSRSTFYRLEEDGLFLSVRTSGHWRRYNETEAKIIMHLIKKNYGLID